MAPGASSGVRALPAPAPAALAAPRYHGWRFDGYGTCTAIPQGGDPGDPQTHATAYQCAARQGLLWVKLQPAGPEGQRQESAAGGIPVLAELEEPGWISGAEMFRDLPYDWATLCENLLDGQPARLPYLPPPAPGPGAHGWL